MTKRKTNSEDFLEKDGDTKSSKRPQVHLSLHSFDFANASKSQKQKNKALKDESDSDYFVKQEVDELSESEEGGHLSKKSKSEKKVTKSDEVIVKNTSDGDKYVDLGKKKRATVRSFKGIPLIDIREFYGNDDDEKPGKKGISLTLEQWETLKKSMEILDKLFVAMKKK
ncbi:hypothetical protein C0989_005960 [Termitomyces sp. Mn162]|nr:hypothetical protein C0989_005960 [Termitomyces sp. Mn162]